MIDLVALFFPKHICRNSNDNLNNAYTFTDLLCNLENFFSFMKANLKYFNDIMAQLFIFNDFDESLI